MVSAASDVFLMFERPLFLVLGLISLPIILLYFLRMRFRKKDIGSIFLWRSLIKPSSGGKRLRRRSILLLLLQLAAAMAAAFAAAGPALRTRSLVPPGVAFIVDTSASMATRDLGEERRLNAAVNAASAAIDELEKNTPIAVFSAAALTKAVLAKPTSDKAAVKAALRALETEGGAFNETLCVNTLNAFLAGEKGAWNLVLFTDGGASLQGRGLASAFGGSIRYSLVGGQGKSVAVSAPRFALTEDGRTLLDFTVWNGYPDARDIALKLERLDESLAAFSVSAEPGWSRLEEPVRFTPSQGAYLLTLERSDPAVGNAPGDSAYLVIGKPKKISALLIGRRNPFIEAVLDFEGIAYTTSEVFPMELLAASSLEAGYFRPDIVVSDGASIPSGAEFGLVLFGEPPPDSPLVVSGRVSGVLGAAPGAANHPLSRFLDWEGTVAQDSLSYTLKGEALVLAELAGENVIAAWERNGYRCLVSGIDLARSDLGLKSAWPILFQNYLQWFSPRTNEQSEFTLTAGESVRRLASDRFQVDDPSVALERLGPTCILTPRQSGLFQWRDGEEHGWIAVNVPTTEIDIAPKPLVSLQRFDIAVSQDVFPSAGAANSSAEAGAWTFSSAAVPSETINQLDTWAILGFIGLLAAEWGAWYGTTKRRSRSESARPTAARPTAARPTAARPTAARPSGARYPDPRPKPTGKERGHV